MSTPRICDDCNAVFSENDEGWSSAPVTINRRNERGVITPINLQLDYCAPCTDRKTGNNREEPRVPSVRGRYDERYTHQLEREAGLTRDEGTTRP